MRLHRHAGARGGCTAAADFTRNLHHCGFVISCRKGRELRVCLYDGDDVCAIDVPCANAVRVHNVSCEYRNARVEDFVRRAIEFLHDTGAKFEYLRQFECYGLHCGSPQ